MSITPEILWQRHHLVFQQAPNEESLRLYRCFPMQRGYSLGSIEEKDEIKFDASVVLAIAQAWEDKDAKVLFFIPPPLHQWALERLKTDARGMFNSLSGPVEKIEGAKKLFIRFFNQMIVHPDPPMHAPPCWVAYGFKDFDPIVPLWLREGLL